MAKFCILLLLVALAEVSYSQTCTVTGTSPLNWANPGPNCSEGGNAGGKTILVIPSGFTVNFNSTSDTWSGTQIEIYGTLIISHDVVINSSITVYSGGLLSLQAKLSMGSSSGCGYGLAIKTGGIVDVGGTGSDRLSICGKELMKGNGSCNDCGGDNSGDCAYAPTNKPYCEPDGGFQGPLGYDENGYNGTLPITLATFEAHQIDDNLRLNWSTASEENFDKFIIEHSADGQNFDSLGYVTGAGNSKQLLTYSFTDSNPIIGKNYYRLKSTDYDMSFEYSAVVVAEFTGEKNISVYPNPAFGRTLSIRTNFSPEPGNRIEFYDNLGLKLMEISIADYESVFQFNTILKQGSYLLRYISADHNQVIRFYCK